MLVLMTRDGRGRPQYRLRPFGVSAFEEAALRGASVSRPSRSRDLGFLELRDAHLEAQDA